MQQHTLEVVLPHKLTVTIRETNGEDDDIISKVKDNRDNTAVCKFLAGIITDRVYTADEIALWPIASKYYLLLKSRIFSLGNILKFKYDFESNQEGEIETFEYTEDLSKYDTDLKALFALTPEEYDKAVAALSPIQIKPYKYGSKLTHEKVLTSGKAIRLNLLDSGGELLSMTQAEGDMSVNDKLRQRGLEVKVEEGWAKVSNFKPFSTREMLEIRAFAEEVEVNFNMPMVIHHPTDKEKSRTVPLIGLTDFFFPRAI